MFKRFRKKPKPQQKPPSVSAFTTDSYGSLSDPDNPPTLHWPQPVNASVTTDSMDGTVPAFKGMQYGIPEAQASWYISQTFIGYSMCAAIAKHWLVDKAIGMPARDALRQGYRIDGKGQGLKKLENQTRKRQLNTIMREFITTGRTFGGAIALFVVDSTDPNYYEKPFNPDGVMPGQYKGIKIIEPTWVTPELTSANVQDPGSMQFYVPTFWRIGTRLYHKSHLCFYIPFPVSNLAKNSYRFFGVSVPERIYERVYAAERTANEAPQLAMTKRLLSLGIKDLGDADKDVVAANMAYFMQMRDNYGVNITGDEDTINQFDTALGDLDTTIMTQYQLVAASANVPATKLLGTTPKGFNATGEYEESSYREELESMQTNDLEPLMDRHLELLSRSMQLQVQDLSIVWEALDSPTAKEYAEINDLKAKTAKSLVEIGAIDGDDVRKQLAEDRNSDFYGLDKNDIDISGWLNNETDQNAGRMGAESEGSQVGGQAVSLPGSSEPTV